MTARVELLGRIAIHGGKAAGGSLPGRRAELVFAYLVGEHGRIVTQDELANALWPDTLPDSWSAALRSVVSEVRRFLEDAGLGHAEVVTARGGYRLQIPTTVVVDLDEVRQELTHARALLDAGDGTESAVHAARSAALAGLPFLPNHDGDWVDGIRRELVSIRIRALDVEARGYRSARDHAAAAAAAARLVEADPFSEAGHQLRIRILGEAGDRAGAMRAYEHCRRVLADELGVKPSAETETALQEAMHAAGTGPALPAPSPSSGPPTPGSTPLGDLSVLVIEDHDFQRRTAVRLLRGLGVGSATEAADGAAALLVMARSPQPDVIVCDIDMPGMDGIEFIRRVAERGLASAVVIASGLDSRVLDAVKAIGEAQGLQVLGALEKPLTPRRLGDLLASYRRPPIRPTSITDVSVTAHEVRAAFAEGQMTTLFEPAVDLTHCRITGAEAVGRWIHPRKGTIPPSTFLPVLVAEGLMPRYVQARLDDACEALRRARAAGLAFTIGLDVGPAALGEVTLADRLADTARAAGAEPSEVTCEVAEHTLPGGSTVALDVMTRLRVKGFGLALDHFGARSPAPERLARIPITQVKIDGGLVTGAADAGPRRAHLEETIDLALSLGVPAAAGGCDSEADFDLVVEMGLRYVQGSFIGAPTDAAGLLDHAGSWTPPAR